MNYNQRIARMQEMGVLSSSQAERLAHSLTAKEPSANANKNSNRKGKMILSVIMIVLVTVGVVLMMSSPETNEITTQASIQDVRTSLNQPEEIGNMGSLSQGMSATLFIIVPLLLILAWFMMLHNGLVNKEETVLESWAQVESNYQRRADLIPNILETVVKYMKFEAKTLTNIVQERSDAVDGESAIPSDKGEFSEKDLASFRKTVEQVAQAQEESSELLKSIEGAPENEQALEELYAAQHRLGNSMKGILAIAENYPTLRSADQMLTLQAELEGAENRINIARMRFNEAASDFNAAIRRMPASLIASMGGFKRKAYFQADQDADKAVKVAF